MPTNASKLVAPAAGAVVSLLLCFEVLACADGLGCAVVRQTPDGFVAVRSKPNASSAMVGKLKPYQIVVVYLPGEGGQAGVCNPTPHWVYVECVPENDGGCEKHIQNKLGGLGYVNSKLLVEAACPTNLNF